MDRRTYLRLDVDTRFPVVGFAEQEVGSFLTSDCIDRKRLFATPEARTTA